MDGRRDAWITCNFTSFLTVFQVISGRWMDDLQFYFLSNSISVISGRCMGDNEWLCAMEPHSRLKDARLKQGLKKRLLGQQASALPTGAPISGRCKDGNERLCPMECRLQLDRFPPQAGLKLGTASSVGQRLTH